LPKIRDWMDENSFASEIVLVFIIVIRLSG